ncbi:MAG: response regulator [Anaerolineae bacterium]
MPTILYVEDHPPARLLMSAIVSDLTEYRLLTAGNGAEARAIAAKEQPTLYILDLDLPDTDGGALAEALHQIHPAPAIIVSAYAEAIDRERFGGVVIDYLAKPLDPDHVAETLKRALGG